MIKVESEIKTNMIGPGLTRIEESDEDSSSEHSSSSNDSDKSEKKPPWSYKNAELMDALKRQIRKIWMNEKNYIL